MRLAEEETVMGKRTMGRESDRREMSHRRGLMVENVPGEGGSQEGNVT